MKPDHISGDPSKAFTYRYGTDTRGDYMTLPFPLATDLETVCMRDGVTLLSRTDCLTITAVHEFGHVLGFVHEALRPESDQFPCDGPNGMHPSPPPDPRSDVDTLITAYDQDSIENRSYCSTSLSSALSQQDINGVRAIYGSRPTPTGVLYSGGAHGSSYYALRYQRPPPTPPRSTNAWYLKPTDTSGVEMQTFVGPWERMRVQTSFLGTGPATLRYGDVVGVLDVFDRWLSARDTGGEVDMRSNFDAWEKWVVESVNGTTWPDGSVVPVNAPFRLRSQYFGTRLTVTSSGDVRQTSATSVSEWRFNGPMLAP